MEGHVLVNLDAVNLAKTAEQLRGVKATRINEEAPIIPQIEIMSNNLVDADDNTSKLFNKLYDYIRLIRLGFLLCYQITK